MFKDRNWFCFARNRIFLKQECKIFKKWYRVILKNLKKGLNGQIEYKDDDYLPHYLS